MKWSSAVSSAVRLDEAIAETASRVRRELGDTAPDLAVVFASPHHAAAYDAVPELVRAALEPKTLIGCSAGGVIGGGHEIEGDAGFSLTAASLPRVGITPFHTTDPVPPEVPADPPPQLVVFPEPFSFDAETFLHLVDHRLPGSTVVGGVASGARERGGNALFLDEVVHRDGLVGVALDGDVVIDTVVAQGCRPIGEPMFVTRCERNFVYEVDGRSPAAVLSDLHRRASSRDKELFRSSLFLGLVMREQQQEYGQGDFLIRNVLGLDGKTGAVAIGALVRTGMVVQFHLRDARTSAEDLDQLLGRHRGTPAGSLLFSCLGRGMHLYGRADHDTDLARRHFGDVPLGGFFCNGEIGPVQGTTFLHGYTSAFGLFPASGRVGPRACSEAAGGASTAARMLVRTRLATAVVALVAVASVAAADTAAWRRNVDALGLPLTVVDAKSSRAFLVFVTGDGGFQRVDQELADGIAAHGVTTVALSTIRYFVATKAPEKVAADLRRIVDAVAVARQPVYAGGYSFGAEVVPDVVARNWSADERARLGGLLLLAPSASASFRVDPLDWVRDPPIDPHHLVEDSVRRLAPSRVVCIAGADDGAAVCNRLADIPGVAVVHVPGTHHFENGMPRVIEAAVRELFARERPAPPAGVPPK